MTVLSLLLSLCIYALNGSATVTVYHTTTAAAASQQTPCIGAAPCDGNVLTPMPNPTGPNLSQIVPVQLYSGGMTGMSLPVAGSFSGFSIELSVANQLIGNDGNKTNPIFLNLMSTLASRAGQVIIRIGGNSQESASVSLAGLPNDTAIEKVSIGTDKTFTPTLLISPTLIYAMGNVSSFVPVKWFLGVPFNDTNNPRLTLAEIGQQVLGKNLLGLQLGNEPDLYFLNGIRNSTYQPQIFTQDWGQVLQDYINDPAVPNKNSFVGPSVCCGGAGNIGWTPEQVFDTGFLTAYSNNLAYISVEHYPTNNCNDSGVLDPNALMPELFLNHGAVQSLSQPYLNTSQIAASMGKPFIMFETNTGSCGGFSGLSDSFVSALWAIDYSLNMASVNFSNALFHVGGQSDYYNPFTPPPTNQSHYRQWTISPTFYATMVVAEALGNSGNARVLDLFLNNNNQYSPGYVIYENGNPKRVVLINHLNDPSGASNYTAYISVGGNATNTPGATPASVQVKYLLAPSVVDKYNLTWAGQTFGGPFASDGRLTGQEMIYTFACDQTNNVCAVTVPAPGVAVVFLDSQALSESEPTSIKTFATTTTATGTHHNTATVAQAVLATSNGRGGGNWVGLGSTSPGSSSGSVESRSLSTTLAVVLVVFSVFGLGLLSR